MKHTFIHALKIWLLIILSFVLVNDCKPKETGDEVIKGFLITEILFRMSTTTPSSQVSTLAGYGAPGSTNGKGTSARFYNPYGVTVDSSGNVFVADTDNGKIRKITPDGVVTTFAGGGSTFTDGTGTSASFSGPYGITINLTGTFFVADTGGLKIRKITPEGVVTSLAGISGYPGSTDGAGASARFYGPAGVAVDSSGNVYVADAGNRKIRKITPDGFVSTFAGTGISGSLDGDGTLATFSSPYGITIDANGNIYVGDSRNNKIRKISPVAVVTTLAGSGTAGSTDGLGTTASFNFPTGVATDSSGNILVADRSNNKIRKITPDGNVTTLAGDGTVGSTDGSRTTASFYYPFGVAVGPDGTIYVADSGNNKIRKIAP
jgi:sugar lactone lactonase YvrE